MKTVEQLHRERPRSLTLRISLVAFAVIIAFSWGLFGLAGMTWKSGLVDFSEVVTERSARNFERFLGGIRPYPLQGKEWDWGVAADWAVETIGADGVVAIGDTLSFSIAAIVLAALLALLASLSAARNVATPEPFLPGPSPPGTAMRALWGALVWGTRLVLILVRSIPEYVWAFILLWLLGVGPWPGVLALALHNSGILGRLFAEVVENGDPRAPRALRALGASRLEIATTAIWPAALNRFLLFFFYRWETCVREATVLGILGFAGLGHYIAEARGAQFWDHLLLWTLVGSAIVLAGDFISAMARRWIRHAN